MAKNEVKIGDVTYQLNRVFAGSQTVTEVMIDAVVDRAREESAVDVPENPAV